MFLLWWQGFRCWSIDPLSLFSFSRWLRSYYGVDPCFFSFFFGSDLILFFFLSIRLSKSGVESFCRFDFCFWLPINRSLGAFDALIRSVNLPLVVKVKPSRIRGRMVREIRIASKINWQAWYKIGSFVFKCFFYKFFNVLYTCT